MNLAALYWCPTCGVVWVDTEPPICRHGVNPLDELSSLATPPSRMVPLPPHHPFAVSPADETGTPGP